MQDPERYHQKRAQDAEEALKGIGRKVRWTVVARLIAFFLIVGNLYLTWGMTPWVPLLGTLLFVALFLYLVRLHANYSETKGRLEEKRDLHRADLERIKGNFPEGGGLECPVFEHPYAEDLDLFAPKGLLAWLDRSFSRAGQDRLLHRLLHPSEDPVRIQALQAGVAELAEKADARMEWRARGRKL
ncbi:MAG: hypothetical protein ABEH38_05155, partial [Flavobacteriales bacterium]